MELTSEPSSCSCLYGQRFPPGFRFQPTDEELVVYYLKRKICRQPILRDVIGETDVYKREPEELPELSNLKTGDRQWFFFSPRDRKYPNGARSNRATKQGFWKVTGRDRIITYNFHNVGVKKTLVFYKGRTATTKPKRTDWVMYEYTMDEEELKRCPSAQDYYALYRIFKKSGIGPKNGEQYGAPFREEDWVDDDCLTVKPLVDQEKYTNQDNDVANVESPIPHDFQIPSFNIEELMKLLEDEPCTPEQLVRGDDTESTLLDHSLQNPNLPAQHAILHATSPHNVQANFDVTQCSTSQPQLPEAPEFTSAPIDHGLNPQAVEEDFLDDFLEVDDLGPEPSINNFNKPGEIMEIQQYGYDVGAREARHPNQPYVNNAENGMVNPFSTYFSDNHETMNSQQLYLNEVNEGSNRLWSPNQRCNIVTPAVANHEVILPATLGVVYDSHSLNGHPKGTNSNQITTEDGTTNSRLSSALWGSLESIPATPASAAESPPANMAFEQTSTRSRVIGRNMDNASGNTSRSSGKSMSGFLCVFILGVLCAMLWILLGTSSLRWEDVSS